MKRLKDFFKNSFIGKLIEKRKMKKLYRKRLEEIKQRDPFIYK